MEIILIPYESLFHKLSNDVLDVVIELIEAVKSSREDRAFLEQGYYSSTDQWKALNIPMATLSY